MATNVYILTRKVTHFLLWRPGVATSDAPHLIIGNFKPGNPPALANQKLFTMTPAVGLTGLTGLWEIAANECQLTHGQVCHYWFEVEDTCSNSSPPSLICRTDPMAFAVDWCLFLPDAASNSQDLALRLTYNFLSVFGMFLRVTSRTTWRTRGVLWRGSSPDHRVGSR
jgi:hypothetical protein